jgi:hypothetical protein
MPSKTRIANKTQWALRDILTRSEEARDDWKIVFKKAERQMDAQMMVCLARLRDKLADIERLAFDAQQGDYRE